MCRSAEEAAIIERFLPAHIDATRAEKGCESFRVERSTNLLVSTVDEIFSSREAFTARQERTKNSEWGT